MSDQVFMQQALDLANRGRFTTSPNPNVGCVIVQDGEVVGQGWHKKDRRRACGSECAA